MTADLSAFILARVAEDEAAAKAAAERSGAQWGHDENEDAGVAVVTTADEFRDAYRGERGLLWDWEGGYIGCDVEDAVHIARHDPARVLAQCAALREVVEAHPRSLALDYCETCFSGDFGRLDDPLHEDYPCPTLRALAGIWRDHDEWREEWA